MVETKAKENLNNLETDLNGLIDKNKQGWNKLVNWNYTDSTSTVNVRQDKIPYGIVSTYKESDLIHHTSSSFNSRQFCDFNDYLPKLVLLAHIVNDEFQQSVRNIFNVNERNGIGYLTFQDTQNISKTTKETTISIETLNDIMTEIDNESKLDIDEKSDSVTTKMQTIGARGGNYDTLNEIKYTAGPVKLYSRALVNQRMNIMRKYIQQVHVY